MSVDINKEIQRLIHLDLTGDLTAEEAKALEAWSNESEQNRRFLHNIRQEWIVDEARQFHSIDTTAAWEKIRQQTFAKTSMPRIRKRGWLRYVAIILPIAIAASILLFHGQTKRSETAATIQSHSLKHPTLTLANGKKLTLNRQTEDEIHVHQDIIAHNTEKSLIYDTKQSAQTEHFNTITVPCGSEFQVVLADGTKIWLNADTELKYPIAFTKNERRVYLKGEAYFEVVSNPQKPFFVETQGVAIKVLGTNFNINTHCLEGIQTVLVQGSVALCREGREDLHIRPGELANFDRISSDISVRQVKTDIYTAWKGGYFVFDTETLEKIMNMLSRWYDKEILFTEPAHRQLHFSGHLKRYDNINTILSAITEVTGVKFKNKGRTILVL